MKCKSFHFTKSGVIQPIAAEMGRVFQGVCDKIPPAYPCENEKCVFIGVEMGGKLPGAVDAFCKDLNPRRTQNVAFYVVNNTGDTSGLANITEVLKKNGVGVCEPLGLAIKGGLFKKPQALPQDIEKVLAWGKKISETL